MSLLVKLIIDLSCSGLNTLGGIHFLWMRRYMMPIVLAISSGWIIWHYPLVIDGKMHDMNAGWWWPVTMLPAIGTLSIGYGKDGNFGRALWIGLQCLVFGLGLAISHHLILWLYIPYVIFGCVLGGLYRNWWAPLGDAVTGLYMGLIIFMVH